MQQEKTLITPEHYKQTDWLNFYVGSEGTIINNTGCKFVKYAQDGVVYVGIEAHGKRYMKQLARLVYETHIRKGNKLPEDMSVGFIDGDPSNCSISNLKMIPKGGKGWDEFRPLSCNYQTRSTIKRK